MILQQFFSKKDIFKNNNFKRLCKDIMFYIFIFLSSNNKFYLCNYEYLYS